MRISARDADQLALAGGQAAAALAEPGVVARGQSLDEIVRADEFGGGDHPLELAVDGAERDVLGDRAREQLHLLGHHPDLLAQHRRRPQAQIEVVEQDASALGLIQAAQQLGEGALAGAGRPGDAEHLAGRDFQIDALERRPGIRAVAVEHALEHDMAAHPQGGAGGGTRSVGSFSSSSRRANAARTVCSCCQAPTTWRMGPRRARPGWSRRSGRRSTARRR